tara:strand:- start:7988 stop:9115 length:1128 start_codon:yes stop_codon:yes gene_type:complete
MKFLRRLGRKIKKGIKKLMGSKLGRIVGMIGLSMAMGAVAKNLIGKFGAKAAGEATATAAAGATEAATAGATEAAGAAIEEIAVTATKRGAGDAVSAGAGQLANTGQTAGGVEQVIENVANAGSNSEAATTAINHIEAETMASNGMINPDAVNVSSSITESVDAVNNTFFDPNRTVDLYDPVQGRIEAGVDPKTLSSKLDSTGAYTGTATSETAIGQRSLLDPPQMITPDKTLTESLAEGNIPLAEGGGYIERRSAGEVLRDFGSNIVSKFDSPSKVLEGAAEGVLTGVAMDMIRGEPDFTTPGVVMPQPIQEAPIDANIRSLPTGYRVEDLMTKMKQINNPQNGLVFGTGSRAFMTGLMNPNAVVFQTVGLPTA